MFKCRVSCLGSVDEFLQIVGHDHNIISSALRCPFDFYRAMLIRRPHNGKIVVLLHGYLDMLVLQVPWDG